jgi:hypothetical protein
MKSQTCFFYILIEIKQYGSIDYANACAINNSKEYKFKNIVDLKYLFLVHIGLDDIFS